MPSFVQLIHPSAPSLGDAPVLRSHFRLRARQASQARLVRFLRLEDAVPGGVQAWPGEGVDAMGPGNYGREGEGEEDLESAGIWSMRKRRIIERCGDLSNS